MHEYSHSHPLSGDRRFEHTHAQPRDPVCLSCGNTVTRWRELPAPPYGWACPECGSPLIDHEAQPVELAHPELADVARAPAPGSPADLRERAAELRREAGRLRFAAERAEDQANALEARAARDEQEPPSETERVRRLLEGGLW